MKLSHLVKLLAKDGSGNDPEVFIAQQIGDDFTYHQPDSEVWNEKDPESQIILYPGDLVSG